MRTLGVTAGDLDWTIVDGATAIRQRIVQRLQFWLGEWFQDTSKGIPYLPSILGRRSDAVILLRQVITNQILDIEGVTAVRNITIEIKTSLRRVFYAADVDTIYGTVTDVQAVSPVLPLAA